MIVSGNESGKDSGLRYYCTYFDKVYLARALALHASLKKHAGAFRLYVLCWDNDSIQGLKDAGLDNVVIIAPQQVETFDTRLVKARQGRSPVEYYFTAGPAFMDFIFTLDPQIDLLTYLDADMYFFSSPEPIYAELGGASVGIIAHRFAPHLEKRKRFGLYNVGWVSFRRDKNGLDCLRWWKDRCIEWCYDYLDGSRFADQKYLDEWTNRFKGVLVITHPGANLAPWNIANYKIELIDRQVMVDGQPLIFFHFQGFREIRPWLFDSNLGSSGVRLNSFLKNSIFRPYLEDLHQHMLNQSVVRSGRNFGFRNPWIQKTRKFLKVVFALITGSCIIYRPPQSNRP